MRAGQCRSGQARIAARNFTLVLAAADEQAGAQQAEVALAVGAHQLERRRRLPPGRRLELGGAVGERAVDGELGRRPAPHQHE
eukprot:3646390-Prymnesium_polylepis.1